MIYGSMQAEFMGSKYNDHIHRYGTPIFGKIDVYISKSIILRSTIKLFFCTYKSNDYIKNNGEETSIPFYTGWTSAAKTLFST